jgi:uncharacterized protein (DUF1501 family)
VWQGGGASHLDTFDMKPGAPREIRGEFREMRTSVPGIRISEHLPRTARIAHKLTFLRSMRSDETNHERAAARFWSGMGPVYASAAAGGLAQACEAARRAVERGARFAVAGAGSRDFDTHAGNFRRLRETVLPEFDHAFSMLVNGLDERGLLATTLVIAAGEFGRTPRINAQGGRDHHSGAWTVVMAGAGLEGGRVLGATDRTGAEVTDLPVSPEDLVRTVRTLVGIGEPEGIARGRLIPELVA